MTSRSACLLHFISKVEIDSPTSHIRLPAEHVDKALNFLQCTFENNESNNCITVVYMYYITIDYCLQQLSCVPKQEHLNEALESMMKLLRF